MSKQFVPLLMPLRSSPTIREVTGFDCETVGEENRFDCGTVSTREGDFFFTDAKEMLNFMTQPRFWKCLNFATNLSFDMFALFQAVAGDGRMPGDWELFDNGARIIHIRKTVRERTRDTGTAKHQYCYFLDSLNIFLAGVEEMGKILQKVANNYLEQGNYQLYRYYNEQKLEAPTFLAQLSYSEMTPEQQRIYREYNAADARVTRKFMEWFQGEVNNLGGELKRTAASTALDLYRRKYLREANLAIPQPNWDCLVDSRFSYYGGRTEDFAKGRYEGVWEYDVTSMYPASMVETQFPYPSPEHFIKREKPSMEVLQHEGFSKVRIHVPYMDIPPLPYRMDTKLIFPTGELVGVWTNLELRYALSLGCEIIDLEWCYYNTKTFNPFQNYVLELFAKRMQYKKAKMATEEVVKLFLNGLYGKFAQNFLTEEQANELGILVKKPGGTFRSMFDSDGYLTATGEEILATAQNPEYGAYLEQGFILDRAVPKLKAFMNPILSSYTTARARVKLHEYMVKAMGEGARILYCDTDSLYVTRRLSFAVPDKQLGMLEEKAWYPEMVIVGPKAKRLITTDGKLVTTYKGIPGKTRIRELRKGMKEWEAYIFTCEGCDIPPMNYWQAVEHSQAFKHWMKTKPREEIFANASNDQLKVSFQRILKFKEAIQRGKMPNQIAEMTKNFDPFDFPKRRILGEPTVKQLLISSFETVPWEIDGATQWIKDVPDNMPKARKVKKL